MDSLSPFLEVTQSPVALQGGGDVTPIRRSPSFGRSMPVLNLAVAARGASRHRAREERDGMV